MTDINDPALCEQRATDPAWQAEQQRKNADAVERFAAWRAENALPLLRKGPGERV